MNRDLKTADGDDGLELEFMTLASDLAQFMGTVGIHIVPFHGEVPHYQKLSAEKKRQVLEQMRFYYDLCVEQIADGSSLRDTQTFTWRALKKCGLTPNSDLLSYMSAGDIVEIYSTDNTQIFRNLEFFEHCSYTLEDLYCREWWVLYRRDDEITAALLKIAEGVFSNQHPEGLQDPVRKHLLVEIASAERFRVELNMKFIGPLYANKQVKALICVDSARLL